MLRAIHVQNRRISVRAQIDIEGGDVAQGDTFYIVYPDNSRAEAKIIDADPNGATIEVSGQNFRIRRATAADALIPTGSDILTPWIVTESL